MRVLLLGAPAVEDGGRLLSMTGNRAKRALALLALNANRAVPTEQLVDTLWPDDPPATCRDQIYNCITGLRRTLRLPSRDGTTIERCGGGYRLAIAPDQVDALAFEEAVRRASGGSGCAIRALRAGLRLWTGDALEGVADGTLAAAATRLERLRGEAWEDLFVAELAVGRDPELLAEMLQVVEQFPMQEGLVRRLATVLWEEGRQPEALDVCRNHRRWLRLHFGVDAGPAVRLLESRITARPVGMATEASAVAGQIDCAEVPELLDQVDALLAQIRDHLHRHEPGFGTAHHHRRSA